MAESCNALQWVHQQRSEKVSFSARVKERKHACNDAGAAEPGSSDLKSSEMSWKFSYLVDLLRQWRHVTSDLAWG